MEKYSKNELKTIVSSCNTPDDLEKLFDCCLTEDDILIVGTIYRELIDSNIIDLYLRPIIEKFGLLRMLIIFDEL